MSKRWQLSIVLIAVVASVILFVTGWSVRDAILSGHGDLETTISTFAAWTGDASKIALGALIAAVAGLGVGWMNRSEARADREDAGAARFADRVADLAAQMVAASSRYATEAIQMEKRRKVSKNALKLPDPELDSAFWQAAQELRLLVRLSATYAAIDKLERAMHRVGNSMTSWFAVPEDMDTAAARYAAAALTFEDAIRVELGRPPIERPAAPTDEEA